MSFSKELIYNITINNLGVTSPILLANEQDPRTNILNNYYEVARDTVLEAHDWGFASSYQELSEPYSAQDNEFVINPNFEFAFKLPNNCISPRAIMSSFDRKEKEFKPITNSSGEKLILTKINPCLLRYTRRVDNEALFTAPFVSALGFYLAYLTAQGITGSGNKKNTNLQDYHIAIRNAIVTDARKYQNYNQDDSVYTDNR